MCCILIQLVKIVNTDYSVCQQLLRLSLGLKVLFKQRYLRYLKDGNESLVQRYNKMHKLCVWVFFKGVTNQRCWEPPEVWHLHLYKYKAEIGNTQSKYYYNCTNIMNVISNTSIVLRWNEKNLFLAGDYGGENHAWLKHLSRTGQNHLQHEPYNYSSLTLFHKKGDILTLIVSKPQKDIYL